MFPDHPAITATNSTASNRLGRVDGHVVALADGNADQGFVGRIRQIRDHKGTLIAFWRVAPSEAEKQCFVGAWASKTGGGVEHAF